MVSWSTSLVQAMAEKEPIRFARPPIPHNGHLWPLSHSLSPWGRLPSEHTIQPRGLNGRHRVHDAPES